MQKRQFGSNPISVRDTDCVGPGDVNDGDGAAVTGTVEEGGGTVAGSDAGADEDAGAGAGVGDPITVMFGVTVLHPKFNMKCDQPLQQCDMPNSVTYLHRTPKFEWYVVRCGLKNWHHKDMCLKEIDQRARNILTILGSMIKMIKVTYITT